MDREKLTTFLDDYLRIDEFADYGPQGLQVEGNPEVNKITTSVDSALPVLEKAIAANSQLHLVHHGIFWGEPQCLVGPLGNRVRALFTAGVSLYAAHLALDAHPEIGNNAILANMLEIDATSRWAESKGNLIGIIGNAPANLEFTELLDRLESILGIKAQVYAHGSFQVKRVGIVSGGGAGHIAEAAILGIDTYITGEIMHAHYWDAAEYGINVICAGHYATEKVGVKALGSHLAEKFELEVEFIDFPTGL
ncbi:MAG: Nif3-like dinuclear metal center hexameric protein [Anaerolineales bacterium]|nr:Nif3-like dinuclear metal center hexameric protein [Anaerolineales bacterium]